MLNEEKIKLMTKLAMYEKHTGKKTMKIAKYFRSDYISWNMIKTALAVTLAYALIVGLWLAYHLEEYVEQLYSLDYLALVRGIVEQYFILLICYMVISYLVYSIKYALAMKSLKRYDGNLKRLKRVDRIEPAEKKGRGIRQ
jgi:type III secretory pathway component EscU